jgi:uncharacterized membrane protein
MPVDDAEEAVKTVATAAESRSRLLLGAAAALALVGLVDALYLTVKHLTGQSVQCTVTTGCEEVLTSAYATVGGYPLAALGALAYFMAFSLATLALFRYGVARQLLFYLVMVMLLTSLFLIYVQAFVLGHWCQYCLLSAAVTFSLMGVVVAERFSRARA